MQSLGINQQQIYYAMYSSSVDATTSGGLKTGGKEKTYHSAVSMWANVSPQRGSADFEPFGTALDYDRTMVTTDMDCPIDEQSILWVDRTAQASVPHNYIVRKVAKSINSITYAIKEVTKS